MPPTTTSTRSDPMMIDLDATLVTAHSEKEHAAPTFKRGFGFHPLCAFVDHGGDGHRGTGRDAAAAGQRRLEHRRRPHHRDAGTRWRSCRSTGHGGPGRKVLVRTDGAGGTHAFVDWLHQATAVVLDRVRPDRRHGRPRSPAIPQTAWTPAYDADGKVRDGAWVAEAHRPARPVGMAGRDAA